MSAESAAPAADFNSTMGRLKGFSSHREPRHAAPFQFHYGTIKSQMPAHQELFNSISIPLWDD